MLRKKSGQAGAFGDPVFIHENKEQPPDKYVGSYGSVHSFYMTFSKVYFCMWNINNVSYHKNTELQHYCSSAINLPLYGISNYLQSISNYLFLEGYKYSEKPRSLSGFESQRQELFQSCP